MPTFNSLDSLVYSLAGALAFKLGQLVWQWITRSTKERREATNRLAKEQLKNRLLTESLIDHRNAMLKSGNWNRDTLPPFIKEI